MCLINLENFAIVLISSNKRFLYAITGNLGTATLLCVNYKLDISAIRSV